MDKSRDGPWPELLAIALVGTAIAVVGLSVGAASSGVHFMSYPPTPIARRPAACGSWLSSWARCSR